MRSTRRSSTHRNRLIIGRLDTLEPRWLLSAAVGTWFAPQSDMSHATNPDGAMFTQYQVFLPAGSVSPDFATPFPFSITPGQIQTAYGIDQIKFGSIVGDGAGQTIAIIDAYDDPSMVSSTDPNFNISDLHRFDQQFGLPDPPSFTKVDQTGGTNYPQFDAGWSGEISLDVEYAHAVAPQANIILVEANDNLIQPGNEFDNLDLAAQWARAQPGVSVVTMSFGGTENANELNEDSIFTTPAGHQGITFFASTGDDAAPGGYPAFSPNVVAVGGTSLFLNYPDNTWNSELGWYAGGGGVSLYEPKPEYQYLISTPSATQRTIPDVSMNADPFTGVAVLDTASTGIGSAADWEQFGGTSLASPLWAGLGAIIDQGRALSDLGTLDGRTQMLPRLYSLPNKDFHDIVQGNNGFPAAGGYDLVTGLGSPVANLLVPDLGQGTFVSGTIFQDSNSNGLFDTADSGLPGVTVRLMGVGTDGIAGTSDDVPLSTKASDLLGQYGFMLTPDQGIYVSVQRPTGYYFTVENIIPGSSQDSNVSPNGNSDVVPVGSADVQINAGLIATHIEIAGVVFNDSDLAPATLPDGTPNPLAYLPNGIYDYGETGPAGSVVTLYDATDNTQIASQTTGNGGAFNFSLLDAGTYYIVVTPAPNYLFTRQNQGTDPTRQSVVDWNTGKSGSIKLLNGQQDLYANAGIYLPRVVVSNGIALEGNAGQLVQNQMQFPTTLYIFPGQSLTSPVTLNYSPTPESALADVDFKNLNGTSEIDPGQTTPAAPPTIALIGNDVLSPNKVFLLNITSSNSDIIDPTVVGTIANDDPDQISVDASRANVTETPAGVVAYFTVSLAAPFANDSVSVQYTIGAEGDTARGATTSQIQDGTATLGDVDYVAQSLTGTLTFAPGQTTLTVPVLVLDNFNGSGFNINNEPQKTLTLTLSNPTTASGTVSPAPVIAGSGSATGIIQDDPVRNATVNGNGATYVDNSGNTVNVTLSGPGTAAVQLRGNGPADGIKIVLTGTTKSSQLNIKTTGPDTSINEISDDSPLGSINGAEVNLTGSLSVTGGLSRLTLNSIMPENLIVVPGVNLAPGAQVSIGGGPLGSVISLNANLGRVTDTTFDLGIPIQSMKVASFNDQDGQPNQIFAPAIGRLKVAGDFHENIRTNNLQNLSVGGTISNSNINAKQSIGHIIAGGVSGSEIYAGMTISTGLPADRTVFTPGSSIRSVNLRGNGAIFSESIIAAAEVGRLNLGVVNTNNSGSPFGVSGLQVAQVHGSAGGSVFSVPKNSTDLGAVFSDQDFLVQVYGV